MQDSSASASNNHLPHDWHLAAFDSEPRTRLVFGNNCVDRVGELVNELGGTKVLVVTDQGIVRAGHVDRVVEALTKAKLTVATFDSVQENPTTVDVAKCVDVARENDIDFLVGLGGGSSMDTAKGCNFIFTNGGCMQDYWGAGKASQPMLPLIAIPTTAGTGSECQSYALIAEEDSHQKMACGDPKAAAKIALLDPTLTLSQPRLVTADTGIDAIAHAVETAVTKKRNAISLMYSHEAFKLLVPSFPKTLENPNDLEARGRMLLGAALAGTAIENSMLGAAHSTANPLTAHYDVIHGQAVGVMLPHVVRFNAFDSDVRRAYAELAAAPEIASTHEGHDVAVEALVQRLDSLLDLAAVPRRLTDHGVKESMIPTLAAEASKQWTAAFNPRPIESEEFEALYRSAI